MILVTLSAVPAEAEKECADAKIGNSGGTSASASTADGYEVHVRALGQSVDAEALHPDCVGDLTAKSSKTLFKTAEDVIGETPPLP